VVFVTFHEEYAQRRQVARIDPPAGRSAALARGVLTAASNHPYANDRSDDSWTDLVASLVDAGLSSLRNKDASDRLRGEVNAALDS